MKFNFISYKSFCLLITCLLLSHTRLNSSNIFDAEVFTDGKEFISPSRPPQLYLKFRATDTKKWFDIFSYHKDESQRKKLGKIEATFSPNNNMISVSLKEWDLENVAHKQEAIETLIALCRGKHCKSHFSCKTSFSLSLQNFDKTIAESIGFKLVDKKYRLPFKTLELDKFKEFSLQVPVYMNSHKGSQYPHYGTIEKYIFEDLDTLTSKTEWCDFGSGNGLFPLRLLEKSDNLRVAGIEIEEKNIAVLKKFIEQANQKSHKKNILDDLIIIKTDLLDIETNPTFAELAAKGLARSSLMNICHYLSPFHNIQCLTMISERMPDKGRVYMIHDTHIVNNSVPKVLEDALERCVQEDVTTEAIKTIPNLEPFIYTIRQRTLVNFYRQAKLEFPEYMIYPDTQLTSFCFSPSFMLELAGVVGLRVLQKGEMAELANVSKHLFEYKDAKEGEGSKAWYIFEKDLSHSSTDQKQMNFRNSPKFQELLKRATLADEQRKQYVVTWTLEYPFVKIMKKM